MAALTKSYYVKRVEELEAERARLREIVERGRCTCVYGGKKEDLLYSRCARCSYLLEKPV